jgi:chloride channel 3/4/5
VSSPRVILVERQGSLVGLLTVKDVLRFIADEHAEELSVWDHRGELDGMAEQLWTDVYSSGSGLLDRVRHYIGR